MKLLGFSAGRRNGNTEVLIKEALKAAEACGVEVEFIRLKEFDMEHCTACDTFCYHEIENCPHHKDDIPWIVNKFLDCDGVIIGAPVYSLTPSSLFFTFRDRVFGPKMDVAGVFELGMPEQPFVKGRFKARPGGLISVGGALTNHWTSLGLPNLYTATFSAQTEVVDHMDVYACSEIGEACIQEDRLEQARKLGRNVADAMLTGDHRWRGEKETGCPFCHLDMVQMVPGKNEVYCPICGIHGKVKMENDIPVIEWLDDEQSQRDNRLKVSGKKTHIMEIMEHNSVFEKRKAEALEKLNTYKNYDPNTQKSPNREAAKAVLRDQFNK